MEMAAKKIIVALDELDFAAAIKVAEMTQPYADTYKIGLSLFVAHGPLIVKELSALGVNIFLDLKLHDIPMQVKRAVESALRFSPRFLTVHALGGHQMLREAALMAQGSSTTLLAVSILTSLNQADCHTLGFSGSIETNVIGLLDVAFNAGVNGFVASPHEVASLRRKFGQDCYLVCPGVRPAGSEVFDQSRVMTPQEAIFLGADALVIGRPITKAPNIAYAARDINQQIQNALSKLQEADSINMHLNSSNCVL